MAFAVTARQSGNGGETAAETLTTSSATPTADSLFLVCSAAQNDNHQIAPTYEDPSGGGLAYTQIDTIGEVPWDGSASFGLSAAMERAAVGGSPSAFTVTVDHWSNSQTAYYGAVCLDITGHDDTTPIVQSKTAGTTKGSGDSESGSVTLDSAPSTGSLVVVAFAAGADGGGGFATPTLGGQAMTAVTNQDASFTQVGVFSRVIDGTESDATITCTDLGDVVGNFTAIAVEIAAGAGGAVDGSASGSYGYSGTASGQATVLGDAAGTYGFQGTATGQATALGSAAGSYGYSGTATGQATAVGAADGSYGYTGTAQGQATAIGSASGSYAYNGTASGQATVIGSAAGAYGYAGTATGEVAGTGAASGSYGFSGTAEGQATVIGSASGSYGYSGTAAGAGGAAEPAESVVTAQGVHSLIATATGTHAVTVAASGTHDLIVEAEGAL